MHRKIQKMNTQNDARFEISQIDVGYKVVLRLHIKSCLQFSFEILNFEPRAKPDLRLVSSGSLQRRFQEARSFEESSAANMQCCCFMPVVSSRRITREPFSSFVCTATTVCTCSVTASKQVVFDTERVSLACICCCVAPACEVRSTWCWKPANVHPLYSVLLVGLKT